MKTLDNLKYSYAAETGQIVRLLDGKIVFNQKHPKGYLQGQVKRKNFLAHRVAWFLHFGFWPDQQIDHVNGDKTDNRIVNLRVVSPAENRKNTGKRSDVKTAMNGVRKRTDTKDERWMAVATIDYKTKSLGSFGCQTAAVIAKLLFHKANGFSERHGL